MQMGRVERGRFPQILEYLETFSEGPLSTVSSFGRGILGGMIVLFLGLYVE